MGPTLLGMVLAVGLTLLCRRLGAGALVTIVVSAMVLGWYLLLVFQGHNTFYGLPTVAAATGVGRAVLAGVHASNLDFAPVPPRPGYVILTVAGMWLVATIGEVATFRWRRPLVASLPPIALFSFLLIIGKQSVAGPLLVVFIPALLAYWGLEASHRLRSWGRWVGTWGRRDDTENESVTGRVARRMGYSCVAAALVAPVILPSLGTGLLPWRNPTSGGEGPGDGGSLGATSVDPFVELVPSLLQQESEELFRVTAERAAYWRLLSLADFDGNRWTEAEAFKATVQQGLLERSQPTAFEKSLLQRFDLTNLGGSYLPAAGRPSSLSISGEARTTRYNAETRHLEVAEGDVQGMEYIVTSELPRVTFEAMRTARVGQQGDNYTSVPADLSPQVRALAEQWTKKADSDFAKLVALQTRFQTDFAYSENVAKKDSDDYLTYFLTESRTGYCQQFSTAFALLARTLGYPSRVSVGFLPGQEAPDTSDTYVVRGTDAHAWPEIYFEDYGWVRFEPTPRDLTRLPNYTIDPSPGSGSNGAGAGGPQGNVGQIGGGALGTDITAANIDPRLGEGVEQEQPGRGADGYVWQEAFGRLFRWLILSLLVVLVLVPFAKELKTRYRYARATSPSSTTAAAFAQFLDEAGELAAVRRPSESAIAYASRLVSGRKVPAGPAVRLATLYEIAEYSPAGASPVQASEAKRLAKRLRSALWKRATWLKRASRLFSPARLRPSLRLGTSHR